MSSLILFGIVINWNFLRFVFVDRNIRKYKIEYNYKKSNKNEERMKIFFHFSVNFYFLMFLNVFLLVNKSVFNKILPKFSRNTYSNCYQNVIQITIICRSRLREIAESERHINILVIFVIKIFWNVICGNSWEVTLGWSQIY